MSLRIFAAAVAATVSIASAASAGQPSQGAQPRFISSTLDTLERVRAFHETAMSPDGRHVAWVEDMPSGRGDDGNLRPRRGRGALVCAAEFDTLTRS